MNVRVDGQLVFNMTGQMLNAALAGLGLAYVPEELAEPPRLHSSSKHFAINGRSGARGGKLCLANACAN